MKENYETGKFEQNGVQLIDVNTARASPAARRGCPDSRSFQTTQNYERLEIARIYQDSMESIEREERRVRENVRHKNGSAENFEKDG